MSEYTYSESELQVTNLTAAIMQAEMAGYTDVGGQHTSGKIAIRVAETVDRETLRAAITAEAAGTLAVDKGEATYVADGVATDSIVVTGPMGKVASLHCAAWLDVDAIQKTLAGGTATFTFGPTAGRRHSGMRVRVTAPGCKPATVTLRVL